MFGLFQKSKVALLQKKYDKLMREAYHLSKANPKASLQKQREAQEIHKQIINRWAA